MHLVTTEDDEDTESYNGLTIIPIHMPNIGAKLIYSNHVIIIALTSNEDRLEEPLMLQNSCE